MVENPKLQTPNQSKMEKIKEFIESLGAECREGKYTNEVGYYYACDYESKWFFLIIDPSGDVYIKTPFHFSKEVKAIEGAYHSIFQPYHVKLSPGV